MVVHGAVSAVYPSGDPALPADTVDTFLHSVIAVEFVGGLVDNRGRERSWEIEMEEIGEVCL